MTKAIVDQVLELMAGGGNRSTALHGLIELWDASSGAPAVRTIAAHYLADLMDDKLEELAWNLRALQSAGGLADSDVQAIDPSLTVRSLLPSLHLNLAADYYDLGQLAEARIHLTHAESLLSPVSTPDTPYTAMIRHGVERLRHKLK